jgi:AraC-like DNA-binding protein
MKFAIDRQRRGLYSGFLLADEQGLGKTIEGMNLALYNKKYNKLIELASRELSQNFTKPFSLQNFCRRHSVGYENFRKLFRAHTGMAPWDYRIRCKMKNSVELLRNEELNLKEIAEQLGYRSPYEFSAQFKKKFGISPGAYRKKNR